MDFKLGHYPITGLLDFCEYVYANIPLDRNRHSQLINICCTARTALQPEPAAEEGKK